MKIYKFRDKVDGKYCFIIASNQGQAIELLKQLTSIPFIFVESKDVDKLNRPLVLMNDILPF